MSNKRHKNRVRHLLRNGSAPSLAAPAAPSAPEVRTPGEAEATAVRKSEQLCVGAKLQVADALALLRRAEASSAAAQEMFQAASVAASRSVGVDPDDPAGGSWHFDSAAMTFTRTG